jgi:TnpA family transposase
VAGSMKLRWVTASLLMQKLQAHPQQNALAHHALCLNLVTNAVIVWNTVYMTAVMEQLNREDSPV